MVLTSTTSLFIILTSPHFRLVVPFEMKLAAVLVRNSWFTMISHSTLTSKYGTSFRFHLMLKKLRTKCN